MKSERKMADDLFKAACKDHNNPTITTTTTTTNNVAYDDSKCKREDSSAADDAISPAPAVPANLPKEDPTPSDEEDKLLGQEVYNTEQLKTEQQQRQDKTEEEEVHKKKRIYKSFEQRMDELRAYKEKHGHINVKRSENKSLNKFCNNTRYARNNPEKSSHNINDNHIASLDALGFDWSVTERAAKKSFEQRMDDLRSYKERHGHVNVKHSDNKSLNRFCKDIRYVRKHPERSDMIINDERIASLDALGFDWSILDQAARKSFEQRIEDLRAYKEKHGHVNLRQRSGDKSLYEFCKKMRYTRNNPDKADRTLTDDRIVSLDALGFNWSVTVNKGKVTKTLAQRMDDLRAFKEKHGHVNVKGSEDTSLSSFCKEIRYARNNPGKSTLVLTDDRIASLDALGFEWSMS